MNEQPAADTTQQEKKSTKRPKTTDPIDYLDQLNIKLHGLKPNHNAAVVILLGGCTISETAGMIGVHRNTIHRWIKHVPAFRKGLRGAQNEQREAVFAQLDAMGRKAAGVVERAIDQGNPRIALQLLKGIGLLGEQTASRNPYFKRRIERSENKKPDWTRKWQLPTLPRFGRSEVMASSILLLLASLLVVGILNLAQAARTYAKPEASVPDSAGTPAPAGQLSAQIQPSNTTKPPRWEFNQAAHSNMQKLSVSPVVRKTTTITARPANSNNRPIFAEMGHANMQHFATFCIHTPLRARIPDG